jgi:endogenous inhibitor of DNA gyrase (YacG/DUF329 family)
VRKFCPGSAAFTEVTPDVLPCPWCEADVEIWSDEVEVNCPGCGRPVSRQRILGCIDHCKMARECIGPERYQRLVERMKSGTKKSGR